MLGGSADLAGSNLTIWKGSKTITAADAGGNDGMQLALRQADWRDMFVDNPDYSELSYRNKTISRRPSRYQ